MEIKPNRRQVLTVFAASAATLAAFATRAWAACSVTGAQTEGPYWIDELLNRSDIRIDPSDGSVRSGVPLRLQLRVLRADARCAAASGLQVDVWHCDANGLYSDEAANSTVGKKFLRGYQTTDGSGTVSFSTIYPGWYRGRTIHIHFRVRAFDGSATTFNFASQLYFNDAISEQVLTLAPYNTRGARDTTNSNDNIFSASNSLTLSSDGSGGYVGNFDVALNGIPAALPVATATATATATAVPEGTPVACHGDCDDSGEVTVDELVKGVNIALDNAEVAVCPQLDSDGSGSVTVDEIVKAVNVALNGCS